MKCILCLLCAVAAGASFAVPVEDKIVGEPPIEMIWAERTQDVRPPTIDFEDLSGWTAEAVNAEVMLSQTREQQLFGRYVGKIATGVVGENASVILRPPGPVPVKGGFNSINFWLYGYLPFPWEWRSGPALDLYAHVRTQDAEDLRVRIGPMGWTVWNLVHRVLSAEDAAKTDGDCLLTGIEIGSLRSNDFVYFDNLSLYRDENAPLEYEPRRKRGVDPFPGQPQGLNTGEGELPFPTREETILPANRAEHFETELAEDGSAYVFRYRGDDGTLEYRYEPQKGSFSDITARWGNGEAFHPLSGGGPRFGGGAEPDEAERVDVRRENGAVVSTWRMQTAGGIAEVTYVLRLWQKSLVLDVFCPGGELEQVLFGRADGLDNPRLIKIPYLWYWHGRPQVLLSGTEDDPLFTFACVDWYRTNGSEFWARNKVGDRWATFNGGVTYKPKTDGNRNDCFERIFLTVSPRFDEVLPTIDNPASPWMDVTGTHLYRNNGFCSNRESPQGYLQRWKEVARYGVRKMIVTNHEAGWSDYWYESAHTMRTRAARLKGGNRTAREITEEMHALGYWYGFYDNYADYLPVSAEWKEDYVMRDEGGQFWGSGNRFYIVKPSRAPELSERIAREVKRTFGVNTGYCDVHTATAIFAYVDYDHRVPGAATFAGTLYAYGEVLMNEREAFNGPVSSEGPYQWLLAGLSDGDYARQEKPRLWKDPWLVDFDLLKIHPLCVNIGMGNMWMFYGNQEFMHRPEMRDWRLDRFLAATIAYGHGGWLELNEGVRGMLRSYYMIQQLQSAYTGANASQIRYADANGTMWDTSAALARGAHKGSQVYTKYDNGLEVWVNGQMEDTWQSEHAELPPNGWYARSADGELLEYSANVNGRRIDYVESPAYDFLDARGTFVRRERLAADGAVVSSREGEETVEVIPVDCQEWVGVSLDGRRGTAIALDREGEPMGKAETRLSRGLVYIVPFPGAFSYRLRPRGKVMDFALSCEAGEAAPGERLDIKGARPHKIRIPAVAKPGTRAWFAREEKWIDFTVVPPVDASLSVRDDNLLLHLTNTRDRPATFRVECDGTDIGNVELDPGESTGKAIERTPAEAELLRPVKLVVGSGTSQYRRTWWLHEQLGANSLHDSRDDVPFQPGPYMESGLTLKEIQSARAAWLRLEVVGAVNKGVTRVLLNGRDLGSLTPTPSYFNEIRDDRYSPISLQLPSDVIASLNTANELVIENPGQGVFKMRRFWIELEMDNGRNLSSRVTSTVLTQPPGYFFDPEIHYPTNPNFSGPTRTEIQFALDRAAK